MSFETDPFSKIDEIMEKLKNREKNKMNFWKTIYFLKND